MAVPSGKIARPEPNVNELRQLYLGSSAELGKQDVDILLMKWMGGWTSADLAAAPAAQVARIRVHMREEGLAADILRSRAEHPPPR